MVTPSFVNKSPLAIRRAVAQGDAVLFRGQSGCYGWLALLVLSAAAGWHFGRGFHEPEGGGGKPPEGEGSVSIRSGPVGVQPGSPQASWMERVKAAKPSDFPGLMEQWMVLFPEGDDYLDGRPENALRFLFAMWLAKDANGFLKTATDRDSQYSHCAAQVLGRAMPEKAVELIFGPDRGGLEKFFVADMAMELAERHPALYLKASPDDSIDPTPHYSPGAWATAIIHLAKTDAVAAADACLKLKEEERYSSKFASAILAVASAWKPGDLPMAEWVKGIADPALRDIVTHARLCALSERDPRAALAEFSSVWLERGNGIPFDAPRQILGQLAKVDPAEALRVMRDSEALFLKYKRDASYEPSAEEKAANPFTDLGPQRGDGVENNGVRLAVLRALAEDLPDDPAALFPALRRLRWDVAAGDRTWQLGVEADLIQFKRGEWSPSECLAVADLWENESQGSEKSRDDFLWRALAARAATVDPELTLGALDQLPESARSVFACEIIQTLAEKTPDRIIPLLSQLSAKEWDRDLGGTLGRNPEAYAGAIASLPAGTTIGARGAFMEQWGELDPEAAARWLESLPDDTASKPAAAGLAFAWAEYDSRAVSSWAASLPDGPSRDAAAASLSYSFAKNHPEESWQWANSISDPRTRHETLITLDHRWDYDAPPQFRAALDQARRVQGMPARGAKPPPDPNDPFSR